MIPLRPVPVLGAALVCVAAHAQGEAVQWRMEDGGNGHWYRLVPESLSWQAARDRAMQLGGHLATLTSEEEALFAVPLGSPTAWLGASAPTNQGCDTGLWTWVTGEPWVYSYWSWAEPGNCTETGLAFAVWGGYTGKWNNQHLAVTPPSFFMEWSADCDGDGIVDYGQIMTGDLADANLNGVPDCCDQGVPCPSNCPPDIIRDGHVDGADLASVLSQWGTPGTAPSNADIDTSGLVDGKDLATVLSAWGPCP